MWVKGKKKEKIENRKRFKFHRWRRMEIFFMMITRGVKTRPSVFSVRPFHVVFPPFFSYFLLLLYTFSSSSWSWWRKRERPLVRSWTNNPVVFPLSGSKEIDETRFAGFSAILLVFCSSFHFLFCIQYVSSTYICAGRKVLERFSSCILSSLLSFYLSVCLKGL